MALAVEKLAATHRVAQFDCGREALNVFLRKHALASQAAQGAQTYVGVDEGGGVVGFYSLAVGHVLHADAPDRLARGLARHPVPVMMLARLATALDWQGKGIGAGLLRDAILRTLQAADIAGIRAIVVHAKDGAAQRFYAHFGFAGWVDDPLRMYLLVKDARAAAGR